MLSLLLTAFVSVLQVAAGAWIGWAVCRAWTTRPAAPAPEPEQAVTPLAEGAVAPDREEARRVVARLRDLAKNLADDVVRHGSDVEAAGADLSQLPDQNQPVSEVVLAVVARIVAANGRLREQLSSASAKIREQEQQLELRLAESRIDPLTRVANRRGFDEALADALARSGESPLCVAMIDIDYFKRVNDRHGHDVGDEVLRNVAAALAESLGEAGFVGRHGGEEFAVLFASRTLAEAAQALEAARRGIAQRRVAESQAELRVTVSVGVGEWRLGDDGTTLRKRADEALYAAKHAGRDRTMVHDGAACHPPAAPATAAARPKPRSDEPASLVDRPALFQELRHRLNPGQHGGPLSLLLIDVGAGDGREVGRAVLAAVREGDTTARFADGQYAVLLPNTTRTAAEKVAERIIRTVCRSVPAGSPQLAPRVGLVEADGDEDAIRLVQRASRALSQDEASLATSGLTRAV